jgi:hypothetical protein
MPRWSPLQIIGLIVGIDSAVLGIAAVASTGFDTAHIYTPQHAVGSFPHSPLLGVIEIGFGLLMVIGAAVPGRNGWLFAIAGAVVLLAAIFSPVFAGIERQRRIVRRSTTSA